jgi:capsular exopolysaccharide synthesis family protein
VAELGAPIPLPPVASDPELRRRVPAIPEVQPVEMGADVLITRTQRLDAIEQYRKLGAALHEAQVENGLRALLCTSALMGEGKTVTACNLALTLSKSYGRRVLLIDADLRRPQIHTMFGIPNTVGLGDALTASEDTKLAVQQITPHLSVITAGTATSDPMTGLISERLRQVIAQASNRFDWVIIDTPPVLIVPDARVLVSIVDAVLLVVRAGSTPFRTVLRAVELIKRDRIFGTVLNCVEEATLDAEYGYDRYYAAAKPA